MSDFTPGPSHDHIKDQGKVFDKVIEREEGKHKEDQIWKCVFCNCINVDAMSPACQNCGRDFLGRSGTRPSHYERDARPGLRDDVP